MDGKGTSKCVYIRPLFKAHNECIEEETLCAMRVKVSVGQKQNSK